MIGPLTYPQIAMICVLGVWGVLGMLFHGHPRGGHHNMVHTGLKIAGLTALLGWGGFWVLS